MSMLISEFYGKKVISNEGKILGDVKGVMLNFEDGSISHLLLTDAERLIRSPNPRMDLQKNSVAYKRVKKVTENVVVGIN
jgi:sporulation protein YlmC with PRC-barrel domain